MAKIVAATFMVRIFRQYILDGSEHVVAASGRTPGMHGLTRAELLALPAAIDLDTANRALSIGRSTGYALAKRGRYPVKVLRLGNAYRVITTDLLRVLEIGPLPGSSDDAAGRVA